MPVLERQAEQGQAAYTRDRVAHHDRLAGRSGFLSRAYQRRLRHCYRFLVPPGLRVLEVGCGEGDLLASLRPSRGVGVDFSPATVERAADKHPDLHFVLADAHDLDLQEHFDVIILSDLVNDLWDVQEVLERLRDVCLPETRVILNFHSRLWLPVLGLSRLLGLTRPVRPQNWLTYPVTANLLRLSGFEVVRHTEEVLLPLGLPLVSGLCNRFLVRLWPFRLAALSNFVVARPSREALEPGEEPLVSVVVPARNEEGNIPGIFERVPEMGRGTELIFVEGHSKDDTYAAIVREAARQPGRRCKVLRQTGVGKGDAVRLGFEHASGEVLMILDADLTVTPEDLPRFYAALRDGRGDFINGVRLVYPMEDRAMRFFNLLGNKFFSLAFSWLLGQPVLDTLCGTKVLWRANYRAIARDRDYFGKLDPFGDFDLLFGAAKQQLRIVDMPVRYRERTYGATNIQRWKHGYLLLRMVLKAAWKLKFV